MFGTILTGITTVLSFAGAHTDLLDAVYELVETHKVDDATLIAAIKKAMKDLSDAQMHNELP